MTFALEVKAGVTIYHLQSISRPVPSVPPMMRLLLSTVLLAMLSVGSAYAQDPTFTQFFAARTYINPAFAGADDGLRVHANYRNLWTSIPGDFSTYAAGVDIGNPALFGGIGFQAVVGNEGEGQLQTQRYSLMYSYRLIVLPRMFDIHFGVDAAYMSKQIRDWDAFVFSDQLHPIYGNVNPSNVQRPEQLKVEMPDFNAGFLARFNFMPGKGKSKTRKVIGNTLGFAAHHLTSPNESLTGRTEKLPVKFVAHYSMMWPVTKRKIKVPVFISPNIMYEHQRNLSTMNFGIFAMRAPLMLGVWYRNELRLEADDSDAIMFNLGIRGTDRKNTFGYQIGYSYDLTISKLAGSVAGSHEIALSFEFRGAGKTKSKNARNRARNCYNFNGPKNTAKVF
jgi:type IX secretion system PorP/SprF family membrane protein